MGTGKTFRFLLRAAPLCALLVACGDDDKPMNMVVKNYCTPAQMSCPDGTKSVAGGASCPYYCPINLRAACPNIARTCSDGQPSRQIAGATGCALQCPEDQAAAATAEKAVLPSAPASN